MHPESQTLLDAVAKLNVKPYTELSVEDARARSILVSTNAAVAGQIEYDGSRKELFIPQPDFTGRQLTVTRDVSRI